MELYLCEYFLYTFLSMESNFGTDIIFCSERTFRISNCSREKGSFNSSFMFKIGKYIVLIYLTKIDMNLMPKLYRYFGSNFFRNNANNTSWKRSWNYFH